MKPSSFAGLAGFLTALGLALLLFGADSGWGDNLVLGWKGLGVKAMDTPFTDMDTGCRAKAYLDAGHDPYTDGSYNRFGSKANYPPLLLSLMGAYCQACGGSATTGGILFLFTIAFFALLSWGRHYTTGFLLGLGLSLGSGALALERGNSDLLMLPLVGMAAWLPLKLEDRNQGIGVGILMAILILGTTSLKLFPAFGIVATLAFRQRRTRGWAFGCALLGLTVFAISNSDLLRLLLTNTPGSPKYSYGLEAMSFYAPVGVRSFVRWGGFLAVLGLGIGMATLFRTAVAEAADQDRPRYGLFLTGAGIFIATYLLSSSFNYRLIFALLCLPYMTGRRAWFWSCWAVILTLFCIWPAVVESMEFFIMLTPRILAFFFVLRQGMGFLLVSAGLGWLLAQAWEALAPDKYRLAAER